MATNDRIMRVYKFQLFGYTNKIVEYNGAKFRASLVFELAEGGQNAPLPLTNAAINYSTAMLNNLNTYFTVLSNQIQRSVYSNLQFLKPVQFYKKFFVQAN